MEEHFGDSPVEGQVVEIPLSTTGFIHVRWLFGISEPSTVGFIQPPNEGKDYTWYISGIFPAYKG